MLRQADTDTSSGHHAGQHVKQVVIDRLGLTDKSFTDKQLSAKATSKESWTGEGFAGKRISDKKIQTHLLVTMLDSLSSR